MRTCIVLAALAALSACGTAIQQQSEPLFLPSYEGIETRLLDTDLVNFTVTMRGARTNEDVRAYGDCAAAQYALIRGYRFARHVRTSVEVAGNTWRGDGVYTISADVPRGTQTLDAGLTVAVCREAGVPTI